MKLPPKQPKPDVTTPSGEIVYEWDEGNREWVPAYQPQTWWQKLLRLPPKVVTAPRG